MPFDVLPQETQTEVGRFQKFADALLRGCAITHPLAGYYTDSRGGACALGAVFVGLGIIHPGQSLSKVRASELDVTDDMERAYFEKYRTSIPDDNDTGRFTREQIAARIAAL